MSALNSSNNSTSASNVSQTKSQIITPGSGSTVKTLYTTSASGSTSAPIISITTNSGNLGTGYVQQAVPININSNLSQVLRQFSAINSSQSGGTSSSAGSAGSSATMSIPLSTISANLSSASPSTDANSNSSQNIQILSIPTGISVSNTNEVSSSSATTNNNSSNNSS